MARVVLGVLLLAVPRWSAAIDVYTDIYAEVKIDGSVSAPRQITFMHRDENPLEQVPGLDLDRYLYVSDSLDSLHSQVFASSALNAIGDAVGYEHEISTRIAVGTSIDPFADEANAVADEYISRIILTDEVFDPSYRFAFTWERFSFRSPFLPSDHVRVEDGSIYVYNDTVSPHPVLPLPWTGFRHSISDIAPPGSAFRLESSTRLVVDSPPPAFYLRVQDVMKLRLLPVAAGQTQQDALQPESGPSGLEWLFDNFPSGLWFDPPTTSELTFEMLSPTLFDPTLDVPDSSIGDTLVSVDLSPTLFNRILDFPTGFDMPVTISAEGQVLGTFGPGDMLDFVAALGHGVTSFTVSGISPPAMTGATPGFALKLEFNEPTADFRIYTVPEPTGLMLGALGAMLVICRGRKGRKCVTVCC